MASPAPEQFLGPSQWPLAWVGLAKDLTFDLGSIILLSLLIQWFLRRSTLRVRLVCLVPPILLVLFAFKGMPEFWAKTMRARTDRLPLEACWNPFSAVVVLGGGLAGNDDLAASTFSRLRYAARWLAVVPQPRRDRLKIVLSGGPSRPEAQRAESDLMREVFLALRRDVNPEQVLNENQSLNTRDNATRTAALLGERGQGQTIALVTSWLHMPRAFGAFRAAGFTVCPVPSPAVEQISEGVLNFRNGERTVRVLNEYAGFIGYRLMGWF